MINTTGAFMGEASRGGGAVPSGAEIRILDTVDGKQRGRIFPVGDQGISLGRSGGDVVLADPSVSRRHAEIRRVEAGFELRDLGSSNGTWFEEQRITRHLLSDGDCFRLGNAVVRFSIKTADKPSVAQSPEELVPTPKPEPKPEPEPAPRPEPTPEPEPAPKPEPESSVVPESPRDYQGLSLVEVFEQEGLEVEAGGNRPFLIDEPEAVWYVEKGKVEVFTVGVEDGKPRGARTHFVTLTEGSLMIGMAPELFQVGSGFLAVGSINTSLRKISLSRLKALAADQALAPTVAEWIDGWVSALSAALTDEIPDPPLEEVTLIPGESMTLPAQHQGRPNKGVGWLDVVSGKVLFIGMEELTLDEPTMRQDSRGDSLGLQRMIRAATKESALFPVSGRSWIEALVHGDPGTVVHSHSAGDCIGREEMWRGLEIFHRVVCQCEFINKRLSQVDELNRLKSKAEYADAARRQGLSDLASVLSSVGGRSAFSPKGGDDSIFEAAVLVGEALEIEVRRHPEGQREKTFEGRIGAIAKASRFRTRAVALRDDWWRQDGGPILGKLGPDGNPVALLPTGPKAYECVDPATGSRNQVTGDFADNIDPFGVTFYRPFGDGPLLAKDLVKFGILGLRHDVRWLILMGIGLGLLGTLTPIFTGKLFDSAIPQADRGLLIQFTTGLFLAALVAAAFQITQSIAVLRIQGRMDYSIQSALWDRLLDLPSTFFRGYSSGDLADRAGGIAAIRDMIAGAGVSAILGSLSSVFYVVLMFKYSMGLAVLAMFLTLIFVAFTTSANLLQLRLQRDHMQLQGRITGLVLQFISGVAKIRVAGAENHAFSVWARQFSEQRRLEFGIGRIQNAVAVFGSAFSVISSIAIFFVLYKMRVAAAAAGGGPMMSTGQFVAFTGAYGAFLTAMHALSEASLNLLRIVPVFERLKPIIQTPSEVDDTKAYPGTLKGAIELANIQFRYSEDGPWILQGISLKIRPGEMVAFVGSSGSGKSTLLRLMLGFETPDRGAIYYDGQDLASVDLREVRQQLGVVLQDAKVLPADIFRNIVGASDLTIEHAWEAARMAGFDEDIKELPMGMHTYVSESGGGFSGGQLQRLLISRALVRKPRILFFDEATSALDNRSQNTVTESMERLFATRIVIAHRLSTIVNADRICYLDKGKIVEQGSYEELMALDGFFAALAKRQMA
jgi:ATP-binding cassette subfamily C protein